MFLEHTRYVTAKRGPRPAGSQDRCFYCHEMIGSKHKTDCVLRKKVVMLQVQVTIPVVVPSCWGEDEVDFHRNESTWCASSIVREFVSYSEATQDNAPCLCNSFEARCLGDASPDDLIGIDLIQLCGDD